MSSEPGNSDALAQIPAKPTEMESGLPKPTDPAPPAEDIPDPAEDDLDDLDGWCLEFVLKRSLLHVKQQIC